ncbi:MAG: type II secretion system protein [Planctomycetota bacterium]|jgi:prepilin-type N-terminal cleavage/methylation domain-containing protein
MRKRHGFTLIEVLIAMAIIMVLAGIVYPLLADFGDLARPASMASTVRQVREKIIYHTVFGDTPMSPEGYPNSIEPAWFATGEMPCDVWTDQPLNVQVVHGPKDATFPSNESFVIKPDGQPAGHTAWYNAANGSFCVMVPKLGTEDERLELFDRVNGYRPADSQGGDGDDSSGDG